MPRGVRGVVSGARRFGGALLRRAPVLALLVLVGPIAAGLAGTIAPALGLLPALGGTALSLAPLAGLLAWPGLGHAVALSLGTGLASTLVSLGLVTLFLAGWQGTRAMARFERLIAPLLAVPHAAAAFGLAFLIAPSGWLARLVSPWATGWARPPDALVLGDPWGLALIAGLVVKEVPFLLLMAVGAGVQVQAAQRLAVARALGYGRVAGWLKAVFPALYAQLRLPVLAVLAYGLSTVDMAIILGPATPPTLAVQVVRWMSDPDLGLRFQAAAGALLQIGVVTCALGLWWLGERGVALLGRGWAEGGARQRRDAPLRWAGLGLAGGAALAVLGGLAALGLWSVSGFWPFPQALPGTLSPTHWARAAPGLGPLAFETMGLALVATLIALALTLACLEAEHRFGLSPGARALWLLYLPLLVPQVAFLPGLSALALVSGAPEGRAAVLLGHLVFVLPYVFLALAPPFRVWDARLSTIAAALGAGPARVFWQIRLPMLLAPVLGAFAVGLAVSVGQYLPTLLLGGGRVATLTTEAVALAAGGERGLIAVMALAQTAAAMAGFVLALAVPRLVYANRRGMWP